MEPKKCTTDKLNYKATEGKYNFIVKTICIVVFYPLQKMYFTFVISAAVSQPVPLSSAFTV